tara:strand:- start:1018 stop:1914 length:897 start_codon:yes stop_codon:yes gene_type:complete
MKASEKVNEMLKELTENIISKLIQVQNGEKISPWECPWDGDPMPVNFTTGEYYHGINIFNLWLVAEMKGFTSNKWCTPKQLKTYAKQNNLEVEFKGEKCTQILRWVEGWIPESKKNTDESVMPISFPRIFYVLNRCQIRGLPEEEKPNTGDDPVKTRTNVMEFVNNTGATVKHGDSRAYYHPRLDYVGMPAIKDFKSEDHYWNVLFHELTHWTGHEARLNRLLSLEKKDYAYEELIAEMGSALISAVMGVPSRVNHDSYINGYIKLLRYDYQALRKAGAQAGKAYEYLLNPEERKEVA